MENVNKPDQAIMAAYWFLVCDVEDYIAGLSSKAEFKQELEKVLKNLETYVPICDPEKMFGNHL
jgi:hypothetical protein